MAYSKGHVSSTSSSKCIICNKRTSTYLAINEYTKSGVKINTDIVIPVCDGEHYKLAATQEEVIIGHAKALNRMFKGLGKEKKDG